MYFKLNNGVDMPVIGLGTFLASGEEVYRAVRVALEVGYRHIDTAKIYHNEEEVGRAIKDSGIPREEIFVTSKVWTTDMGYRQTKKAFHESLERLQLDYLDLYLIHWPKTYQLNRETWKAMEELYYEGKVRAIGLSNFNIHHIEDLLKVATVIPAANQVELHPGLQQHPLQEYCMGKGIYLISHSPLARGKVFQMEKLKEIADKYNKSVVNVVVRWGIQRKIFMIPKSVTPERIRDNFQVFDFSLTEEDIEAIYELHDGKRISTDPDNMYR
ncbi:MAG TPA: aldo/keto reductase [Haloplasmataceae bacterium]